MARGPITIDSTQVSSVVCCALCEHWRAFRFTKLEAWKTAAAHEERTHPELTQARVAYAKAKARAATT